MAQRLERARVGKEPEYPPAMSSPATPSPRVDAGLDHAALLYRGPDQLREGVARFLRETPDPDEPVLALFPEGQLTLLDDVLDAAGDRVERLDMAWAGRNPSLLIPMLLDWLHDHAGPARVVSEPLWPGRASAEVAECLRHEALLNHVLADEAVSVLCAYDAVHLDGEVLAGAELTHPRVIDEAGPRASEGFGDPLEVARGERWPQPEPRPPVAELPFDGDLGALRQSLSSEDAVGRLAPARRDDLVFAVNEAASNALRHGDGTCRTRVWSDGDRVVSEVHTPTLIEDPLAGRRRPDPLATGGRGLWLINQVCDLVELRSGPDGASLRMHVAVA
jgi:hypothetical protein